MTYYCPRCDSENIEIDDIRQQIKCFDCGCDSCFADMKDPYTGESLKLGLNRNYIKTMRYMENYGIKDSETIKRFFR
jgi:transposase-like protein